MLNFEISLSVLFFLLYCYEGAFSHDRKVPLSGPPNPGAASAAAITSVSACCSSWHPETASFEVRLLWDVLEFVVKHDCRPFLALSKTQVAGKGLLSKRINMITPQESLKGQWCISNASLWKVWSWNHPPAHMIKTICGPDRLGVHSVWMQRRRQSRQLGPGRWFTHLAGWMM